MTTAWWRVLLLVLLPLPSFAQTPAEPTREAVLEEAQAEKVHDLHPYERRRRVQERASLAASRATATACGEP